MSNENAQSMMETSDREEQRLHSGNGDIRNGIAPSEQSSTGQLSTADVANAMQDRQATKEAPAEQAEDHLLPTERLTGFRDRWQTIQVGFVDEPKSSVEQADALVAEVIQTLAQRFAEERDSLERQWSGGGDASTEDMRQALKHYRSFFERLLAA